MSYINVLLAYKRNSLPLGTKAYSAKGTQSSMPSSAAIKLVNSNQCDQMGCLFFHIWVFTTMNI